jgi:hypothetical protein
MGGVGDEIKSGSFPIYAQWMGFIACFGMIASVAE